MKKSRLCPQKSNVQSIKKSKVQFSTRLSGYLGEHQCQEFFEKVNITRQSGISTRNKNSFTLRKSNSFKQTLQLNVPFIADLSDNKKLCICYPVHFFRKKAQIYDTENTRLASLRIYFPAINMRYGNNLKVSIDLKKRYHMAPHEYEMVGYSSLLTLTLEDLALAVYRAKSSSERFKLQHSIPIPNVLCNSSSSSSQIGSPIFIATENFYHRFLKFLAISHINSFKLDGNSITDCTDFGSHLMEIVLKWLGLTELLPPMSRMVFVRRVSSDNGDTFSCSILNSPGPKLRKSKIKEGDKAFVRLKHDKGAESIELDNENNVKLLSKDSIAHRVKNFNSRISDIKRPRGRPRKLMTEIENIYRSMNSAENNSNHIKKEKSKFGYDEYSKGEDKQLKNESTTNSLTDSTSEEKYSFQHSTCSTPETIKNNSPLGISNSSNLLSTIPTTTISVCPSQSSTSVPVTETKKRGRPRKYPLKVSTLKKVDVKSNTSHVFTSSVAEDENLVLKLPNDDIDDEPKEKIPCLTVENLEVSDIPKRSEQHLINESVVHRNCAPDYLQYAEYFGHHSHLSIWKPLREPLLHPDSEVPLIKTISSTGLKTDRKICSTEFVVQKPAIDTYKSLKSLELLTVHPQNKLIHNQFSNNSIVAVQSGTPQHIYCQSMYSRLQNHQNQYIYNQHDCHYSNITNNNNNNITNSNNNNNNNNNNSSSNNNNNNDNNSYSRKQNYDCTVSLETTNNIVSDGHAASGIGYLSKNNNNSLDEALSSLYLNNYFGTNSNSHLMNTLMNSNNNKTVTNMSQTLLNLANMINGSSTNNNDGVHSSSSCTSVGCNGSSSSSINSISASPRASTGGGGGVGNNAASAADVANYCSPISVQLPTYPDASTLAAAAAAAAAASSKYVSAPPILHNNNVFINSSKASSHLPINSNIILASNNSNNVPFNNSSNFNNHHTFATYYDQLVPLSFRNNNVQWK